MQWRRMLISKTHSLLNNVSKVQQLSFSEGLSNQLYSYGQPGCAIVVLDCKRQRDGWKACKISQNKGDC